MVGAMNRYNSRRKALRKRRIDSEVYCYLSDEHRYYSNLHQYSKNKIHCSCPLCAAKTRINGSTISDQRKIDRLVYVE